MGQKNIEVIIISLIVMIFTLMLFETYENVEIDLMKKVNERNVEILNILESK